MRRSGRQGADTTAYQAGSASVGSNLLPVSVSSGAGDGSLTATVATTWDVNGDTVLVDGPLPGVADVTRTLYDAMRQPVGTIAPDPDGAGPLPNPATRTTYNADGQPGWVEQGTTAGQTDPAWAAFSMLQRIDTLYNAQGRKVRDTAVMGAGTVGVTQYSYDDAGRLDCTAVRLNPAVYGSLPASACTLSTEGAKLPESQSQQDGSQRGVPNRGGVLRAFHASVRLVFLTHLQMRDRGFEHEIRWKQLAQLTCAQPREEGKHSRPPPCAASLRGSRFRRRPLVPPPVRRR